MILPRVVVKVSLEIHYNTGKRDYALGIDSDAYELPGQFKRGVLALLHAIEYTVEKHFQISHSSELQIERIEAPFLR